ncbi:MAG: PQQ-binding-like beta-propeller repeat protein, partial [Planctomycetes bacterium]|nr:PQQ-binding-like beta-propeller repeat protein [Planctomycetota bacterium]
MRFGALVVSVLVCAAAADAQVPAGPGDWPQWRGPGRDGVSDEKGLLREWPEEGPPVVWQVDTVGTGYSSLAIKDGWILTQGDLNGVEHVIALSVEDGSVLWAVQPPGLATRVEERVAGEAKQADRNGDGRIDEAEALARFRWDFNDYDQPTTGDPAEIAAARAERLVKQLDKDGDDRISDVEAGGLFRDQFARIDTAEEDADSQKLAAERASRLLAASDNDGDGAIDRREARGSVLDQSFRRIDENGDESVVADELKSYLADRESGKDGQLTADDLAAYYAEHHPGGDGELTLEELRGYYGGYRNGQGDGPRGTPTVDGQRVYALGGMGDLTCLDAATGKAIWSISLIDDLGGGRPGWGYSESPLIVGEMLIVTPGGKQGTLAALDKHTGETLWRSDEVTQGAHYASAVAADILGVPQIVQFARESCFGVSADDGRLLWSYSAANNGTANCCTPVVWQDHVYATSAYGTGGGLAKITGASQEQEAEEVYFDKRLGVHHGGVVRVGDYLYGLDGGLVCKHVLTGENAWKARSVGKGSLVAAGGMLYLLSERQEVALAEATPEEYREHGRFKI